MRVFVLALVILLSATVATLVPIGALMLIHRHTKSRAAFWTWAAASLAWFAAAVSAIEAVVNDAGLARWAAS